jgi:hypothetical protein
LAVKKEFYGVSKKYEELRNYAFDNLNFYKYAFQDVEDINLEFNSLRFRSDEFKEKHNSTHILFTGCSVTEGDALNQINTWPKILYEKIKKEKECSGYFNLAMIGTSLCEEIFNLFKYFKKYGNPNIIFFCMPDALRFYYQDKFGNLFHAVYDQEDFNYIEFISYQYYLMLDQYCKSNNIQLYSFTWVTESQKRKSIEKILLNNFDSFYKINEKERDDFIFNYIEENPEKENISLAKDDKHFGIGYHEYWSKFLYEKYKEKN